jgi:hypothetical protein
VKHNNAYVFLRFVETNVKDAQIIHYTDREIRNNITSTVYQNCIKENYGFKLEDMYDCDSAIKKNKGGFGTLYQINQKFFIVLFYFIFYLFFVL